MTSNTRLTTDQKIFRCDMMKNMPNGSQIAISASGITILTVPAGDTNMVFSSVMSADESKFRRKVGEFMVLSKYQNMLDCDAKPHFVVPFCVNAEDILYGLYGNTSLHITDY